LVTTTTNVTSGSPDVTYTGLTMGYYWVQVTDANGCVLHNTNEVSLYAYFYCNRVNFNTTAIGAQGGPFINPVYLNYADYQVFVSNSYQFSAGMTLYRDSAGSPWDQGGGYIFDYLGSGCAIAISSGGLLSGQNLYCV